MVHVGEEVRFDFVLQDWLGRFVSPVGRADYLIATIGPDRVEAAADEAGHFSFSHAFDQARPGDTIDVRAAAYRERGGRDFVKVRGRLMSSDSPYTVPDKVVARDAIRLAVYQSVVELEVIRPPDDLDAPSGVLRLRRADGSSTPVYLDRPDRRGFTMTGPEPAGVYRITYRPRGTEINATGQTDVDFTIHDTAGQRHTETVTVDTP
jgi:hypothetical protein